VPFGSRAVRDRLRSFNFCMGRSIGSHQRRWNAISSPPPHSIFREDESLLHQLRLCARRYHTRDAARQLRLNWQDDEPDHRGCARGRPCSQRALRKTPLPLHFFLPTLTRNPY
jgi:hypothetical protein